MNNNNTLLDTIMNQIDLSNIIIKHSSTFLTSDPTVKIVPDDLAILIGVDQTMMLCQIDFWVQNHQDDEHCKDGRYWIYETYDDWVEQFPYWGKTKIREILRKLKEKNLIVTGNYNKMSGDNTKWYTVNYDLLDKIMSEKKRLDNTHLSESDTCPLSESDTCHLSENGRPIPNISIPNISLPKKSKNKPTIDNKSLDFKINGAFSGENALSRFDNKHIENLDSYMAKIRERLAKWEETQNSVDYLYQILDYYFRTYQSNFGKAHPPLRPEHVKRVCDQLLSYGFDVEEYCDMIDRYFANQTMVTDHNILHFVEDEIIINRAYESGMGMSDIV